MRIRAKVQVMEQKVSHWDGGRQKTIVAHCVHATEIPEDQRFAEATPSGRVELLVKSDVAEHFPLGKQFYVDFIPVEESTAQ